jgi:hypothetical protein
MNITWTTEEAESVRAVLVAWCDAPTLTARADFQAVFRAVLRLDEAMIEIELSDPTANTPGAAPAVPTDTQDAARWAIMPKTGTQRARVLTELSDVYRDGAYGLTDEEIAHRTGLSPSSVRPRRGELVAGGWIRDSGERRQTVAGMDAIVWVLTPEGAVEIMLNWSVVGA